MIEISEFQQRRQKIVDQLDDNAIVIVYGAQERARNADVMYRFRQESNFYYLTGFTEPDAILLLVPQHPKGEYWLFNRPHDPNHTLWLGPRAGQQGARQDYGADRAFAYEQLPEYLNELLAQRSSVYFSLGQNTQHDQQLLQLSQQHLAKIHAGKQPAHTFYPIEPLIHAQRLIKSPAEIHLMRRAAEISAQAHIRAMQKVKQAEYEYELEAELLHEFCRQGCRASAYDSIVASGANACILHYTQNQAPLKRDALILIDAGGEFDHYAADITRTFPGNGKFSAEQRELYQLVLQAQQAGIDTVRPGVTWPSIQQAILQVLVAGLVELKILSGDVQELINRKAYLPFYMHGSGHWLGLDVHDAGSYQQEGQWHILKPGMTLTVEPGLYFSPETPKLDPRWQGIGIRIEDDILVTDTSPEVLSANAPKQIDELESLI